MSSKGNIGIVGSGLIGRSWAMLFISTGYKVKIYDVEAKQVQSAIDWIQAQVVSLEMDGLLRGTLCAEEQKKLVFAAASLADCLADAIYVQECIPEVKELKEKLYKEMDAHCTDSLILASSTSAMPASTFTGGMRHKNRVIVSHPVNPPYFMQLVELCPTPSTDADVVSKTKALMLDINQSPVILKKELAGFVQPRVQYAIIQQCMKLVSDGVMSVEDVDKIMSAGMGRRYSFMGPFETAHLNAEGFQGYVNAYTDMIYDVSSESVPAHTMDPNSPQVIEIDRQLREMVPIEKLAERRAWRDERLGLLYKLRNDMNSKDKTS